MSEQNTQESGEKVIQTCKKGRSQEDKVGRIKYQSVLLKQVKGQNERILSELRWIRHRLKALGQSDFDVPMLEKYAVKDQVDLEILQSLRTFGAPGAFPKDVAKDPVLVKYGLAYYDVSRRIVRMNKRLHFETGELLFEKRGHRWALTRFAFEVYGDTELDAELAKELDVSSVSRELEEDVRSNGSEESKEVDV